MKGLLDEHTIASDFEVTAQDDDAVDYRVTLTKEDGTVFHAHSKGSIRDGRIFRVQPIGDAHAAKIATFFGEPPEDHE